MWYVLSLNKHCCTNIQHDNMRKMRETEATNRVWAETKHQARVRLLLQAMQKRAGKEVPPGQQRTPAPDGSGKERKARAHKRNSFEREMPILRRNKTNSKTSPTAKRVWRPRQGQPNRSVQTLPRACTRNNNKNFMAHCTEQEKGGLAFGMF